MDATNYLSEIEEKKELFRQTIDNKYRIYNSLFVYLPNEGVSYTGMYIPLLQKLSKEGYAQDKEPKQIIEDFFSKHTEIKDKKEQFDLLFRMIQYIERQVVLFDCVEDASFGSLKKERPLGRTINFKNDNYQALVEHLSHFGVRIVFTAHPTQFYTPNVQTIMKELRHGIANNNVNRIDTLLKQLAFTPFVNREKPTPYDEAMSIIYYLRYVYYDAIGQLYHQICKYAGQQTDYNPEIMELGFWPGGDRDGNPYVTAEITMKVALKLRNTVMKCYYHHLKELMSKLTYKTVVPVLEALKDKLYKQIFSDEVILTDKDILNAFEQVRSIVAEEYNSLYLSDIDDFMGRIQLFGSHFASLDIRQDSSIHLEIMEQIFKQEFEVDYHALSDEEKLVYLTEKKLTLNEADYGDELTIDTIRNIRQIAKIQQNNGERGLHKYIISNSESIFDVLHVYALFRYCGYQEESITMDIVPLFETMEGMKNSESVMQQLYENKAYQAHLKRRNKAQTVMLGFSDGTKDGGYLKANWEIYRTKERLTKLSRANGYQVIFFDGRGGPPARGGGKTHQFYASQGPEIASDKIQITIQGQTITSVYGTQEHASYNIEQLVMAGVKNLLNPSKMSNTDKELIRDLAEKSYEKYVSLKKHPQFIPYLEEMTTLKYYGETNIGSRPTKRKKSTSLKLEDLRAIPFVGSWSLIRQNVPGYYGLGTALESFAHDMQHVDQLYASSAFFRCLIQNSIMSMKKSYFPLTAYMKAHPVFGEFWQNLREEYLLTKKWVLHLTKQQELMENEPMSRLSISTREHIVLPLLTIQQFALQKIQEGDADKEIYEKMVIRTLFGNINASRNSA